MGCQYWYGMWLNPQNTLIFCNIFSMEVSNVKTCNIKHNAANPTIQFSILKSGHEKEKEIWMGQETLTSTFNCLVCPLKFQTIIFKFQNIMQLIPQFNFPFSNLVIKKERKKGKGILMDQETLVKVQCCEWVLSVFSRWWVILFGIFRFSKMSIY